MYNVYMIVSHQRASVGHTYRHTWFLFSAGSTTQPDNQIRPPRVLVSWLIFLLVSFLVLSGCRGLAQPQPDLPRLEPEGESRDTADLPATLVPRGVPAGVAVIETREIIIPTYALESFQQPAFDPTYAWPYATFNREAFLIAEQPPQPQRYQLLVVENEYLMVSVLPELGGRIWQILHKASGNSMFYQNEVVKPSPWGPIQQQGWFGLGGLEWNLPVIEHGYDWGTPWEVQTLEAGDGSAQVIVSTPDDGRLLAAAITITLPADAAYVELAPTVRNLSTETLAFDYWQTAMLAPGADNGPSAETRFVVPGDEMMVHSTGDETLPAPQARFSWPIYAGRDLSRLGNWTQYLGFFEAPAAHGPFVGVYDEQADAGAVHTFPATIVRGSKVFGLGWADALVSDYYTDDGSTYVELHSGLASTFFEQTTLAAGASISWRERWYPVSGLGGLVYAEADAALSVARVESAGEPADAGAGIRVSFYPVRPMVVDLVLHAGDTPEQEVARRTVVASPVAPYQAEWPLANLPDGPVTLQVEDRQGNPVLVYTLTSTD